jgi:ATP-binding cassette subfamily C protein
VWIAVEGFRFDASALLLLLFLFARIVPRLSALQHNFHFLASFLPSVQSITELEAFCTAQAESPFDVGRPVRLRELLQFQSVAFRYTADTPPVLSDLNLSIQAGTTVALVGSSGSGKTTTADLMMGLLMPESGQILVDGIPLDRQQIGAWRRSVSYVAQETFLFHDSIRANLQWAVPGATDAEMQTALRMSAADFVATLPQGMDTVVGDRGVRLSGGERQRIALARALLRQPSLLILDEATSALDNENEARVLAAIRRLHGTLTIVLITHRLAAVAGADVIHVIEGGRRVESGSWTSLMSSTGGRLRELAESGVA